MTVTAQPRRARIILWIAAAAVLVTFVAVALGLGGEKEGVVVFSRGDQVAMIALGLIGAASIAWFTRLRVDADEKSIRVRNLLGSYDLPWSVVREIRFDQGNSWASLELHDDEVVSVMAVQAADKEYAVETLRTLRSLHAHAVAAA